MWLECGEPQQLRDNDASIILSWGFEVLVPLPVQKCSIFAKFITIFNDIVKLLSHFMEKIVTEFDDSLKFSIDLVTKQLVTNLSPNLSPK